MRKLVPLLFVAVALTATGVALSSGSPNDRLASQLRVYGGGQFAFPNGVERSFAIDDHVDGHGAGAAYGTWEYGPPDGPWHIRADITCTTVAGSTAVVGGTITSSEIPDSRRPARTRRSPTCRRSGATSPATSSSSRNTPEYDRGPLESGPRSSLFL